MTSKPSAAMTDHATRAREIVMAIDLTTASAVDGSIELIAAALTRAAEEAVMDVKQERDRWYQAAIERAQTIEKLGTELARWDATCQDLTLKIQATQPVWSKEKPIVAGGYWRRDSPDDETPFPTLVYDDGNDGLECNGVDVLDMGGEWAGPLPLPREA